MSLFTNWVFSARRWRYRSHPSALRRWWWSRTHEVCCNFDRALFAFLAPRLEHYVTIMCGAPGGYPDPANAQWSNTGPATDFSAWEHDARRAAAAFRQAVDNEDWSDDDELAAEVKWAMEWIGRWFGAIWV